MDEDNNQRELFEFEKPKRRFPKLSNFLPKADFERNILITLSLDKVIFIIIGVIMLMVVAYALGVEMGRSRAEIRLTSQAVSKKAMLPPIPRTPVITQAKPHEPMQNTSFLQTAQVTPARASIIAAGSFNRKENAMITITKLRQAGFDAYLGQSQPFFQVCVAVKAGLDPIKELARVRQSCRDAYLKTH